jgi:hypothetical protein
MFKLALYADSLALPRKKIVDHRERYLTIIENWLRNDKGYSEIELKDRARGGITITDIQGLIDHDFGYYDFPGDIAILHCGIVDCAPRPIDEKMRERISKLPSFIKYRVIKYLHNNRSRILKKGRHYVKTNSSTFKEVYGEITDHLSVNYKRVYLVNICPTNTHIEAHSPGFSKNINSYNMIINELMNERAGKNISLIDVNKYITSSSEDIDTFITRDDGHHITPLTHQWIANEIITREKSISQEKILQNG